MPFDSTLVVCLAVALDANTGNIVWQQPVSYQLAV